MLYARCVQLLDYKDNYVAGCYMALILGIDPGSRRTGYGVINANGSRLEYVGHGCIQLPAEDLPQRLKLIFEGEGPRMSKFRPLECIVFVLTSTRTGAGGVQYPRQLVTFVSGICSGVLF